MLGRVWMAVMEVQVTVWTLRGRDSRSDEGSHGGSLLEKVATVLDRDRAMTSGLSKDGMCGCLQGTKQGH